MKISFELDQTLLSESGEFPTEKQNLFQKVLRFEKLRLGAIELLKELIDKGNEIWIYTASSRPKHYIYELFLRHDIKVTGIINRKKHLNSLSIEKRSLSKFPPGFGIDIHVDHAENVSIDGTIFGFNTIMIKPSDKDWIEEVRKNLSTLPVS